MIRYFILLLMLAGCASSKECSTLSEDCTEDTTIRFVGGSVVVNNGQ